MTNNSTPAPATAVMSLIANDYFGSGSSWGDSSGFNNSGTLVNAPVFTNTSPKHFTFDRTSTQYVQGPNVGSFSTWTLESWFKLSEPLSNMEATTLITTTYQDGFGNLYGVINYTLSNWVESDTDGYNDHVTVGFYNGTWYTTAGFVPTVGTWYHVVGTYDGTTLKQWVNGTLGTTRSVSANTSSNGGPVRIARRWDGNASDPQYFFPGDIAVAKIYDGVLTDEEIVAAFNATRSTYSV